MACGPELCLVDPGSGNVGRESEIEREDGGGGEAVRGRRVVGRQTEGMEIYTWKVCIVECVRTWLSILWKRNYYECSAICLYTYIHTQQSGYMGPKKNIHSL